MMKKFFMVLIVLSMILGLFINSYAVSNEGIFKLPTTEEEALEFIQENNIEVPEVYKDREDLGEFTLEIIEEVSQYYSELFNFATSIQNVLKNKNLSTTKSTVKATSNSSIKFGKYKDERLCSSIELKSDFTFKYIRCAISYVSNGQYEIDGEKVILHSPEGDLILNIHNENKLEIVDSPYENVQSYLFIYVE